MAADVAMAPVVPIHNPAFELGATRGVPSTTPMALHAPSGVEGGAGRTAYETSSPTTSYDSRTCVQHACVFASQPLRVSELAHGAW
ncbi:hypothetical protein EON67_09565 [archaeon]|nr:MAG: hypothetical protein EON67_09565 [archaeon]